MILRTLVVLSAAVILSAALQASESGDDAQAQQLRLLRAAVPDLRVDLDGQRGVVGHLTVAGRFLPHPQLRRPGGNPLQPALDFIDAYPALFGGDSTMLARAALTRNVLDANDGLRSVIWQQLVAGIPVHRGLLTAHLSKQGEVIGIGSHFVPEAALAPKQAALAALAQAAPRDARTGLVAALRALGDAAVDPAMAASAPSGLDARQRLTSVRVKGDALAHLTWFPVTRDNLRLAWDLVLTSQLDGKMYELIVDAVDGAVHERQCLTVDEHLPSHAHPVPSFAPSFAPSSAPARAHAGLHTPRSPAAVAIAPSVLPPDTISLAVFADGDPTPMRPGWPTSNNAQPPQVARTTLTLVSLDPAASPHGWMDATFGDTRGNNVDAHTDVDDNDQPDLPRPHSSGSPPTFDFPCDLTQEPSAYRDAAVVNLFYWCNVCHDRFYGLGFTEAFGNFQNDNFGNGGAASDAVQADAQDGGGTDNANFSTPPDGSAGRMQMYTFTGSSPQRDGDLDAYIVIHEYTHGLSNRLIGNGGGLFALQSGGMGEGWSDFMSLCLLTKPGEPVTGTYPVGAYAFIGWVGDNYYRGVRRFPYAFEDGPVTSSSQNPLTFADIRANSEVHDEGEVWCETLWEARANLCRKLGSVSAGNDLIMRLVVAGMKLTPSNPTFLQARDAILQADLVVTGGADQNELWRAFAKRGMGFSAATADSNSTADVVESFDLPGDLRLSPGAGFVASGPPGGPFVPDTTTYTLTNGNFGQPFTWTAAADQPWLACSPASGTLAPGASTTVTVSFTNAARLLPRGTYPATIAFTNTSDGSGTTTRAAQLQVVVNYRVSTRPVDWIAPDVHALLSLTDDSVSGPQALPFPFEFYGQVYNAAFVGSNGLIGFGTDANLGEYGNGALPDPSTPNAVICAAWDDLNPGAGGSVRFGVIGAAPNRKAVVSWVDVPRYNDTASRYTMQVVLSEGSSDIVVNYLDVSAGQTNGSGASATVGIENQSGDLARQFSVNTPSLANNMALLYSLTNQAPTVARSAAAGLEPVHGTTSTTMTALGADDEPESSLTYTWSAGASAPGTVGFTVNGSNAAKASTATFSAPGTYHLLCTIADPEGLTVSSGVDVHVLAPTIAAGATASPAVVAGRGGVSSLQVLGAIAAGGEGELTYAWGAVGSPPGLVSFSANGSNAAKTTVATFSAVGHYDLMVTILDVGGFAVTQTNAVTVLPVAPVVVTAARASLDPVHGTATTTLSTLGSDDGGEAALTYTWSTLGAPPAAVTFAAVNGSNAGKTCSATFTAAGTYHFRCTISDGDGQSAVSDVDVRMLAPSIAAHALADPVVVAGRGGSTTLSVLGAIAVGGEGELAYSWRSVGTPPAPVVFGNNGSNAAKVMVVQLSALGHYDFAVTISDGTGLAISDTISVDVANHPPTVATPATATPNPVAGTTTGVTVLGADDADEATLTYAWAAVAGGPAPVQFSPNGNHAAQHASATFIKAGTYTLACTITDVDGGSVTSAVAVTVAQTPTVLSVAPLSTTVLTGHTVLFGVAAADQFGDAMPAPACTWTVASTSSGTIDPATGLFTANTTPGGPYAVAATSGALIGSATVSVASPQAPAPPPGNGSSGRSCGAGSGLGALVSMLFALAMLGWRRRRGE